VTQSRHQNINIRLSLDEEEAKRFTKIKDHYGLKSHTETLRLIIKKELEALE
jgi:hypothetical protein